MTLHAVERTEHIVERDAMQRSTAIGAPVLTALRRVRIRTRGQLRRWWFLLLFLSEKVLHWYSCNTGSRSRGGFAPYLVLATRWMVVRY